MEKNKRILDEVIDEIQVALKDERGLLLHQSRIAFITSLGTVALIEEHLNKINALKPGANINHLWLKKKKENVKKLIEKQIILPIEEINIDPILDIAYQLEEKRNNIIYGKSKKEEELKELITLFLKLKKGVEND